METINIAIPIKDPTGEVLVKLHIYPQFELLRNNESTNDASTKRAVLEYEYIPNLFPKVQGNRMRKVYIEELRNREIVLVNRKTMYYVSSNQINVAIPSARGDGERKWFHEISKEFAQTPGPLSVILLCSEGKNLLDFVFPPDFICETLRLLKANVNERPAFNTAKRSTGRYELLIPHRKPVDITKYLANRTVFPKADG